MHFHWATLAMISSLTNRVLCWMPGAPTIYFSPLDPSRCRTVNGVPSVSLPRLAGRGITEEQGGGSPLCPMELKTRSQTERLSKWSCHFRGEKLGWRKRQPGWDHSSEQARERERLALLFQSNAPALWLTCSVTELVSNKITESRAPPHQLAGQNTREQE